MAMTTEHVVAATEKTADALVGRLFEASIGMFDLMSVYLGDQLGLYRALHTGGAATAGELATRGRIDARYAREWLEQLAATGSSKWTTSRRPRRNGAFASRTRTSSRC